RSDEIKINILYGPRSVRISSKSLQDIITIRDGAPLGPYNCSADCNPPCTVQWKYKRPEGDMKNVTPYGNSPLPLPDLNAYQTLSSITEGHTLNISCFVEGNPTPTIKLSRVLKGHINEQQEKYWLNYTIAKAQCSDTGTYRCTGNTSFESKHEELTVNVTYEKSGGIIEKLKLGEGNLRYHDLGPLTPGLEYLYQLESCNRINCSLSPREVKVIVKAPPISSSSLFGDNTMLILVGASAAGFLLVVVLTLAVTMYCKTTKKSATKKETGRKDSVDVS
ncbi:uncharacterized protein LOC134230334, partial [Saccostrea cucullata]|uniref:uncharacterized protein LOC134230334 n=1 Tax=Saccostrea cuccullata TaxID=36930 RepID=UPI002ED22927